MEHNCETGRSERKNKWTPNQDPMQHSAFNM